MLFIEFFESMLFQLFKSRLFWCHLWVKDGNFIKFIIEIIKYILISVCKTIFVLTHQLFNYSQLRTLFCFFLIFIFCRVYNLNERFFSLKPSIKWLLTFFALALLFSFASTMRSSLSPRNANPLAT